LEEIVSRFSLIAETIDVLKTKTSISMTIPSSMIGSRKHLAFIRRANAPSQGQQCHSRRMNHVELNRLRGGGVWVSL
jgi:hypothetical protein